MKARMGACVLSLLTLIGCGGSEDSNNKESSTPNNGPTLQDSSDLDGTTIKGHVYGVELPGLPVLLLDLENNLISETSTLSDGSYTLPIDEQLIGDYLIIRANLDSEANGDYFSRAFSATSEFENYDLNPLTSVMANLWQIEYQSKNEISYTALLNSMGQAGLIEVGQFNNQQLATLNFEELNDFVSANSYESWAKLISADFLDRSLQTENTKYFKFAHGGVPEFDNTYRSIRSLYLGEQRTVEAPLLSNQELPEGIEVSILEGEEFINAKLSDNGLQVTFDTSNLSLEGQYTYEIALINPQSQTGRALSGSLEIDERTLDSSITVDGSGGRVKSSDGSVIVDAQSINSSIAPYDIRIYRSFGEVDKYYIEADISSLDDASNPELLLSLKPDLTQLNDDFQNPNSERSTSNSVSCNEKEGKEDIDAGYECLYATRGWFDTGVNHRIPDKGNLNRLSLNWLWRKHNLERCSGTDKNKVCSEVARANASELWQLSSKKNIDWNDDEPILLLHGYRKDTSTTRLPELADYWRDLPKILNQYQNEKYVVYGYKWATDQKFQTAADDLATAIREINRLSGKKVHLIAHSMGGVLARTLLEELDGVTTRSASDGVASVTTFGTPYGGLEDYDGVVGAFAEFVCDSITCHQLDDSIFNRSFEFGKNKNEWANFFDINPNDGSISNHFAQSNWKPTVPYITAIGLRRNFAGGANGGDGLITIQNQRFYPGRTDLRHQMDNTNKLEERIIGDSLEIPLTAIPAQAEYIKLDYYWGYCHSDSVSICKTTPLGRSEIGILSKQVNLLDGKVDDSKDQHGSFLIIDSVLSRFKAVALDQSIAPTNAPTIEYFQYIDGTLTIEWSDSSFQNEYEVTFGTGIDVEESPVRSEIVSGTRLVTTLEDNNFYYVKVRALNNAGPGPYSEARSIYSSSLALAGTVYNSITNEPIPNATIVLDVSGNKFEAQTSSQGQYYLELPDGFELLIVGVQAPGYGSSNFSIKESVVDTHVLAQYPVYLVPIKPGTIPVGDTSRVFHLGDDSYSGSINSQFQKDAQGLEAIIPFEVPAGHLSQYETARLFITVKGSQYSNEIQINDSLVGTLSRSPRNGDFENQYLDIDIATLNVAENLLVIRSDYSSDYDDFEFTNIYIEFE